MRCPHCHGLGEICDSCGAPLDLCVCCDEEEDDYDEEEDDYDEDDTEE